MRRGIRLLGTLLATAGLLTALLHPGGPAGSGYTEVAETLNVPVGSIGPTRQRAVNRLRRDPRLCGSQC